MKTLNEHIKTGQFKNVYLIYGPEVYLRKQYRDRLKDALMDSGDTMNYNYFEGKNPPVQNIIDLCETMPFFAERRVIVVENSRLFATSQDQLTEYISNIPEFSYLIFVEEAVDKRNRLYKTVTSVGYAASMAPPDEKSLKMWIGGSLKKAGKNISVATMDIFLNTVNHDMENIHQELEKLICYTDGRDVILGSDILAVCSVHAENKIYDMIRAVAMKQQKKALKLYEDLLSLKEAPGRILYLVVQQFNTLLQMKELTLQGMNGSLIAQKLGMRDFIVRKNMELVQKFSLEELKEKLEEMLDLEEQFKTGRIDPQLAVELILIKYSI